MTAAFRMDEQVTIEQRVVGQDPTYGTEIEVWETVVDRAWCWARDELPRIAESTTNGVRSLLRKTRLRIWADDRVAMEMRATLHDRGDRVMRVTLGPALLDGRRHMEFMLEEFGHG